MRTSAMALRRTGAKVQKGTIMMWGYGYDGWAWMWVVGSLFVIGVVVLVVVLVRNSTAGTSRGNPPVAMTPTPRQILDERFARGELTTDEYRERVETLGGTP
ncbi:SHOCT domain-containing protein [Microcella frigidaquae]|uniref:Putative membrane protein n=1 Tax=Microcella frigidaquae TaxID=424758 RepID=A0A840XB40_9MICO|nr:putative membrane protein [Microcella frigidaquae]